MLNKKDVDDFRVTLVSELPSTEQGLDNFWSHMSEVTDSFTDVTRFGVLPQLAKAYQQVKLILSAHFQC